MKQAPLVWISYALILIVATALRLCQLQELPPGLYPDEAMNGNNALWALESHQFKIFYRENSGREGLYINCVAVAVAIFGNEPWVIRFPSVVFGLGTVAGMFFLGRELFRDSSWKIFSWKFHDVTAVSATFFLAVSYWHLNFSRIGFRAIIAPFCLVWSFALLFIALRRTSVFLSVLGGLIYGLGFHSYIPYRITPILLIFPYLYAQKRNQIRIFLAFVATGFLAALPLVLYFLMNPRDFFGRARLISVWSSDSPFSVFVSNLMSTFGMFWFRGDPNRRHNFPEAPGLWLPVGIFFAIGLTLAVISIYKSEQRSKHVFLLAWFLLFSLPAALSYERVPGAFPHALRSILMLPAALLAAAVGSSFLLEFFYRKSTKQTLLKTRVLIFIIVFACSHIASTAHQYFVRWRLHPETPAAFEARYTEIGRWLQSLPDDIPKFVIVNRGGLPVPTPDRPEHALPMTLQPILYLTDTWSAARQRSKHFHYLQADQIGRISCDHACVVLVLEPDASLESAINKLIPGLQFSAKTGFTYFYKGLT